MYSIRLIDFEIPVLTHNRGTVRSYSLKKRVVTIGPIFLLGLLGITFFIGSRSRTPTVADQPVIRNHSWASTAADASTRDPTFLRDRLRSDPGAVPNHPPAASAGVRGSGAPRAVSAEASNGREVSWIIHASEGAVKPNETAPASQVPVSQPILGSPQSLRKRWQAGPGNESNPEQVKRKGGEGGGGGVPDYVLPQK